MQRFVDSSRRIIDVGIDTMVMEQRVPSQQSDPIGALDANLAKVQRKIVAQVEARILEGAVIVSSVEGAVIEHKRKKAVASAA